MDSIKSALGHITPNLCFYIRWDLRVMYGIPVHPARDTSMHYFSCLGGTSSDSTKSAPGHITPELCFCIRWDLWVT
jgi:hypothetical protein